MNVHEYQAKELLAQAGAAVPRGVVARSPEEAKKAFNDFNGKVVLKAQVHAGGRGKGTLKGSDPDKKYKGVMFPKDANTAAEMTEAMLKHPLVTKQTGAEGQPISQVLVQEDVDIDREYYLGMVVDRGIGMPVMMASTEGGVDIEEVAEKSPELILKVPVDPAMGLQPHQARTLAYDLGFTEEQIPKAMAIFQALAKVFIEKDCSLAEINPLVTTKGGDVVALDAKMNFDDNALFRHPDVEAMRDKTEEDPAELRASEAGLSFIKLDGNIGCLVNGAGLAMSTMDIIKYHGGEPANFLDVGGGASKEQVTEAFRILLSDKNVKAVLVNIFGGIMKCDTIAEAILAAAKEVGFNVPLVVRLEGTNVEQGKKILAGSDMNIIAADGLTDAAKKVVAAVKG